MLQGADHRLPAQPLGRHDRGRLSQAPRPRRRAQDAPRPRWRCRHARRPDPAAHRGDCHGAPASPQRQPLGLSPPRPATVGHRPLARDDRRLDAPPRASSTTRAGRSGCCSPACARRTRRSGIARPRGTWRASRSAIRPRSRPGTMPMSLAPTAARGRRRRRLRAEAVAAAPRRSCSRPSRRRPGAPRRNTPTASSRRTRSLPLLDGDQDVWLASCAGFYASPYGAAGLAVPAAVLGLPRLRQRRDHRPQAARDPRIPGVHRGAARRPRRCGLAAPSSAAPMPASPPGAARLLRDGDRRGRAMLAGRQHALYLPPEARA